MKTTIKFLGVAVVLGGLTVAMTEAINRPHSIRERMYKDSEELVKIAERNLERAKENLEKAKKIDRDIKSLFNYKVKSE